MKVRRKTSPMSTLLGCLVGTQLLMSFAASAAKIYVFTPVLPEGKSQQAIYTAGKPVGISQLERSDVAVSCDLQGNQLWVNLTVQSKSNEQIDVDPTAVRVAAISSNKPEKQLDVREPDKS